MQPREGEGEEGEGELQNDTRVWFGLVYLGAEACPGRLPHYPD